MTDFEPIVDVTSVRVLSRYIVEVGFANGDVKVIDLEPQLWGEAFEPLLQDYKLFCSVAVDEQAGTTAGQTVPTSPHGRSTSRAALQSPGQPQSDVLANRPSWLWPARRAAAVFLVAHSRQRSEPYCRLPPHRGPPITALMRLPAGVGGQGTPEGTLLHAFIAEVG